MLPAAGSPPEVSHHDGGRLIDSHLLGAPAGVGLAHVGGRLDGGDELEHDVDDADQADDRAGDDAQDVVVEEDGADEDVDWFLVSDTTHDAYGMKGP